MSNVLLAILAIVVLAGVVLALLWAWEAIGPRLVRSYRRRDRIGGWVWLAPGLVFVIAALAYPIVASAIDSLVQRNGSPDVWANYAWVLSPPLLETLRNNLIWLLVLPIVVVVLGLVVAALADRTRYERIVKVIFLVPASISFVAGASIWRYMYTYVPPGQAQRGTVNAIWTLFGQQPVAWLTTPATSTFALIMVVVWLQLGVSIILLSNAIKAVPGDLLEAARLDGAGELRVFRSIVLPHLRLTIVLLISMFVVGSLKAFDVVYSMTGGNYGTDVYATRMYSELFESGNIGHASAIAIVLFLVAVPIMAMNVVRARREERA